jgi:hypothetical protein
MQMLLGFSSIILAAKYGNNFSIQKTAFTFGFYLAKKFRKGRVILIFT